MTLPIVRQSINVAAVLCLGATLLSAIPAAAQDRNRILDFAEKKEAAGPHQLLVLKDGKTVKGQLVNIEGGAGSQKENEPRIVSFRDSDGRVGQFRMGDLLRIYLVDW